MLIATVDREDVCVCELAETNAKCAVLAISCPSIESSRAATSNVRGCRNAGCLSSREEGRCVCAKSLRWGSDRRGAKGDLQQQAASRLAHVDIVPAHGSVSMSQCGGCSKMLVRIVHGSTVAAVLKRVARLGEFPIMKCRFDVSHVGSVLTLPVNMRRMVPNQRELLHRCL
jgi:hypothetical protein